MPRQEDAINSDPTLLGIRGCFIDAPEYGRLRTRVDGAMILENGLIREIGDYPSLFRKTRELPVTWTHSPHVAVFPGLIDLHTHVAQYPAVARGQTELLPWLRQHIFPMEREFTGPKGKREAGAFFDELARNGTTTAMLYTAVYEDSCEAAFQAAAASGLRVIMGKTMMDVGSYGQSQPTKVVSISLHESERLCKTWHGANNGLIEYAVSPRFAVSCSEKMMRGASWLAKQYGTYIQTHLAENVEECEKVRHQFPWAKDYTTVYEKCGLLGPRTVLGHCLHLSEHEREVLASTQSSVAHCPTANLFLRSGILALDQMRAAGLRIGLGSDVAAGPELNMWRVMRGTIECQKARSFYEKNAAVPTSCEALHLATQGAADALGKGALIGSFEPGKEADLLVMDYSRLVPYSGIAGTPRMELCPEDILSLCIHRGGPEAVIETFVRGNRVYSEKRPSSALL